jgi:hypothetical protein
MQNIIIGILIFGFLGFILLHYIPSLKGYSEELDLFIGVIFGFLGFILLHYIPSRNGYREELDLFIGRECIHIHHWITCLLMLLILWYGKYYGETRGFNILSGIVLGLLLEDFLFRNIYNMRNCNK